MQPIGTVAYAMSSQSVDFMLYNTEDKWVYWQRGVSSHQVRNRLAQARIVLNLNGVDHVYDFRTGMYLSRFEGNDPGWMEPKDSLDHSGGTIAALDIDSYQRFRDGVTGLKDPGSVSLADLLSDSTNRLRLEIRTRLSAESTWAYRRLQMHTRDAGAPQPSADRQDGAVAYAA